MANQLKIDFEALDNAITNYESAVQDFRCLISSLDKTIDTLRNSGWKSSAATKFFETYDGNWRVNMEKHILVIEHLKVCLEHARTNYEKLADEASYIGEAFKTY